MSTDVGADLKDRVVLVSGGSQGIGAAIARGAALAGASVVIVGRRPEVGNAAAAQLREKTGVQVLYVAADVADVEQARNCVATTVRHFGRIAGLVNAAGVTSRGTLLDTTPDLFDTHVAVNLRAPFFLSCRPPSRTWSAAAKQAPSSTSSRCRRTGDSPT